MGINVPEVYSKVELFPSKTLRYFPVVSLFHPGLRPGTDHPEEMPEMHPTSIAKASLPKKEPAYNEQNRWHDLHQCQSVVQNTSKRNHTPTLNWVQ